jgi:RHS repeat-associated protein
MKLMFSRQISTDRKTPVLLQPYNWQCPEEYVGSTCKVRFIWGLRYIDDLVTYRNGSTDYYIIQDTNWNIVALTNAAGVVQERYTYSSFGKLNVFDASFVPKSASTYNLTRTFTGQVLDAETGLMLYRNRVYHPTLGRFLQRDPIGYERDVSSLYKYVKNQPITANDKLGLSATLTGLGFGCAGGVIGGTIVNLWQWFGGRQSLQAASWILYAIHFQVVLQV